MPTTGRARTTRHEVRESHVVLFHYSVNTIEEAPAHQMNALKKINLVQQQHFDIHFSSVILSM